MSSVALPRLTHIRERDMLRLTQILLEYYCIRFNLRITLLKA